jgi:dihydropteroate synthase
MQLFTNNPDTDIQPSQHHYQWPDGVELHLGVNHTSIMGILNVTPDSFSDGGTHNSVEQAVQHAHAMVAAGADIIDIGGESTRPGYTPVSLEEELTRVIPVIQRLREEIPHIPLSIDTIKAETARQALAAGAHIVNDIWMLRHDPAMAKVCATAGCPVILSHNRATSHYDNLVQDVVQDLMDSVHIARAAGISPEYIWLDPGIGFAKNAKQNMELMVHLDALQRTGYPVLLGTSRKRFIRDTLHLPVDRLVMGTAATVALGIVQGMQIVRVHDVREIAELTRMLDAMLYT